METIIKRKNILTASLIVILVIAICCLMWYPSGKPNDVTNNNSHDYHSYTYEGNDYKYNSSVVSILMLGIDKENTSDEMGQADAIELMLLDRENKKIKLVSIPRDTMTEIRIFDATGNSLGWSNHHINLAYAFASNPESGCMYASQAVSHMLNSVPITHYASFDLMNLSAIHDLVGPLTVEIPNDSLTFVNKDWTKGKTIEITSENVETYLRARDITVDFSNELRMERQEQYLLKYFDKLKEMLHEDFDNSINEMYNIVSSVVTNISLSDMEDFANMILEYDFEPEADYLSIPGKNVVGKLHDEFIIDEKSLEQLMVKLFYTLED